MTTVDWIGVVGIVAWLLVIVFIIRAFDRAGRKRDSGCATAHEQIAVRRANADFYMDRGRRGLL